MAITTGVEYLERGFNRLILRKAATAIAATGAATNTLSATAHGLTNGDIVSLSSIVTLTNVSALTRYYVVAAAANTLQIALTLGGSAIVIGNSGSANILSYDDYELYYPNQASVEPSSTDYEWNGGDNLVSLSELSGLRLNIDSASVPVYVHSALFSKTEITEGGLSNIIGFGGGNDKSGVTVGAIIYRNAKKVVNGAETGSVTRIYNYPGGTLTLRAVPGAQSREVGSLFGYSFSATPGNTDVNGATITNMATDDFFYTGEA
jgi:hypothetical protein